ncbi:hypothetical protein ASE88_04320 [Sphingomonas sp. Leaf38]|nr:hypothetical protein ASE88_04320 [Sphingomonas sp. Leaf38]
MPKSHLLGGLTCTYLAICTSTTLLWSLMAAALLAALCKLRQFLVSNTLPGSKFALMAIPSDRLTEQVRRVC